MYHSITFGTKNTWDDWHLIPTSRPVVSLPDMDTRYVDIPGAGSIDLSESLTGYPTYKNREGSFEFIVTNDYSGYDWVSVHQEIVNYLHGLTTCMVLEDDPGYFYKGRFSVNEWRSDPNWSIIVIDYNLTPYKKSIWDSRGELSETSFNPFDVPQDAFLDLRTKFSDLPTNLSYSSISMGADDYGVFPIVPIFVVEESPVRINLINSITNCSAILNAGVYVLDNFVFYKDGILEYKSVNGLGRLTIILSKELF